MKAELIDMLGDDLTVVNAARVSFNKQSEWLIETDGNDYTHATYTNRLLPEKDQKLISYLAKHDHWTPFSHVMIQMRETVPIFVARQRFKHMVGFTYNEVSRRYDDSAPEFYIPDAWRGRAENKKQGSSDELITTIENRFADTPGEFYKKMVLGPAMANYQILLDAGVCPEQARMVLPQSMYTSYYVTGSLAAWARAFKLRSDAHAQKEIQDLADQWDDIIGSINEVKYSWEALTS